MVKTVIVYKHRKKIGILLKQLQQQPCLPNQGRGGYIEQTLIDNCVKLTNMQTYSYWTMGLVSIFGAVILTSKSVIYRNNMEYKQKFTFIPLTVLNITYNTNYEISWIYENISLVIIAAHFINIDLLVASMLAHVATQFQILQNSLRRIVDNARRTMMQNRGSIEPTNQYLRTKAVPWEYLRRPVADVVCHHLQITKLIVDIEGIFSQVLLTVMVSVLFLLCCFFYAASEIKGSYISLIRSLSDITGSCLQVLIVCYWGEQIKMQSVNVARAAYEAYNANSDVRLNRALLLIIRRSQTACKITAGGYADLCLTTFTWIMRSSYSTFMVVYNTLK